MTESPSSRDPNRASDEDTDAGRGDESPPATPRWVFAFGIIAIVLILAFLVSHLSGGGFRSHSLS
jgi:hypothetical protein